MAISISLREVRRSPEGSPLKLAKIGARLVSARRVPRASRTSIDPRLERASIALPASVI
jgi:hypothetical protein